MSKKIVVYTAKFGLSNETFQAQSVPESEVEYVYFSDQEPASGLGWNWVRVDIQGKDPQRLAREYKMMSHRLFSGDEGASIWIDSSYKTTGRPLSELVAQLPSDKDIGAFPHPESRNCRDSRTRRESIYDELAMCICLDKMADPGPMIQQVAEYSKDPSFSGTGLVATGILVRRQTGRIRELNMAWNNEIKKFSARDQLSFPYVIHKQKIDLHLFSGQAYRNAYLIHSKYS